MSYSIESAISMLEREADRHMFGRGNYQLGKDMAECAADARKELRKMREEMPRLRELKTIYDRGYDNRLSSSELREDGDSAVADDEVSPWATR